MKAANIMTCAKNISKTAQAGYFFLCYRAAETPPLNFDNLKLARIVTHVADARMRTSSASTTHRQLTDEQLTACGITPDLVRLSVGIETSTILSRTSKTLLMRKLKTAYNFEKKKERKMNNTKVKKLVFAALFAALACTATFIHIPCRP